MGRLPEVAQKSHRSGFRPLSAPHASISDRSFVIVTAEEHWRIEVDFA
jgi:hypothetical protein